MTAAEPAGASAAASPHTSPRARGPLGAIPPWLIAVFGMLSVELSSALSVHLVGEVGPIAAAWMRTVAGALIFLAIGRPRLRMIRARDLPMLLILGAATGGMTMAFLEALMRIPLGTAVAIEFLGPLTVAAIQSRSLRALAWPALALAGVLCLTEPWQGAIDPIGVLFAALSGLGWGVYVLLTQPLGDRYDGLSGLAITTPIAVIATAPLGIPAVLPTFDWALALEALGLGILMPVLTLIAELLALRRMTHSAFGTLMALEPAIALALGLIVLAQLPGPLQLVGMALVVVAGAMAQRGGRRESAPDRSAEAPPG